MRRAEFLLPPVPSFESGGRGKFIGMLLLFIACLSIFDLFVFFYLIIGKKFALVRHTTTNPFFPEKNSFLDRSIYEYIQNYFQSTALTIKSSSIRFTFSQTLNLPLRFKITSKILESTTNTNHLQTVRKKNFFSSSLWKNFQTKQARCNIEHTFATSNAKPSPTRCPLIQINKQKHTHTRTCVENHATRFGFSAHCSSSRFPWNGFSCVKKKKERKKGEKQREREKKRETKRGLDKQRHDGEIFAYPLSTLVTLASNKRQGHSHWRAVCSMSSLPPLFLSSSTRLILRCQLSKTRAPFTEEESSLFPPPRWCNGLRQRIRFALFNAQSRDDDFAAGFTPGLTWMSRVFITARNTREGGGRGKGRGGGEGGGGGG